MLTSRKPPAAAGEAGEAAPAKAAAAASHSEARAPAQPKSRAKKARSAVKRTAKPASETAKQRAHGKEEKKVPKLRPHLVRDSFTMPESDFAVIATLKATALGARRAAKKSELLRAGLRALAELEPKALVAALDRLEAVKTGRPKKGR